jgi:formylglycine-generating enzyme required for sulfatase activity
MSRKAIKSGIVAGVAIASLGFFAAEMFTSSSGEAISPETVRVMPRAFIYRMAGEFHLGSRAVDAPAVAMTRNSALRIMRRQVTAAEYGRCVAAGECKQTSLNETSAFDLPAANINWDDATAYAAWLSKETGYLWRLPTDEEWAFAAGSRFHDDALSLAAMSDPSARWLARYKKETEGAASDRRLRAVGSFGENEYGLLDLSGNVWEWTNTCFLRQALDANGDPTGASTINCGVRVVEGKHRGYVTNFIRDANSGGCAVGQPPSNLGFRLVRDDPPTSFISKLKGLLINFRTRILSAAPCRRTSRRASSRASSPRSTCRRACPCR